MPRDLYHLEGQQLRGLLERLALAQIYLDGVYHSDKPYLRDAVLNGVNAAHETLAQILADGPHSRDEED